MELITSLQNPRIKNIVSLLDKSRERKKQQLFVIEGEREINLAIKGGYEFDSVYYYPQCSAISLDFNKLKAPIYDISKAVFDKIAYRENRDGLIALAKPKTLELDSLKLSDNPFVIILESVEKPGNLGAILRTADAAKVDAVVVCDPLCDVYNPNTIRSSIGCLFTTQIAVCTSQQALAWAQKHSITCLAAELKASQWYHQTDMSRPSAVILGTEADGLSDFWLRHADARIKIPMRGEIDSLNVSVSAAVITFEAMRQRGFQ